MKRSRVALGAGVAVAGYVAYRRFRKPRARLPVHAIPFAVLAATRGMAFQGVDEPAVNVFEHIAGFFVALVALIPGLAEAVGNALQWLFDELATRIGAVLTWTVHELGGLPAIFASFSDWITSVLNTALQYPLTLFNQLEQSIVGYVESTITTDLGILNWLEDLIARAIQNAISITSPFVNWLEQYVIDPLYNQLDGRITAVYTTLNARIDQLANDLGGIPSWLDDHIRDIAQGLIDLAFLGIKDLLDAVRGALDFLLWVGAHAIGWWEDLAHQLDALLDGGILKMLEDAITGNEDTVDHLLNRVFDHPPATQ